MELKTLTKQTELGELPIGSAQWWDKVASIGTPIQIPIDADQVQLIFLWRRKRHQSDIQSVYLDINGVINHHDFNAAELIRYQNTDVYYYICNVKNSWNGTYALIPVPEEAVQPAYCGDKQQQITQHRNWIMKRREYHIADPLNQLNIDYGRWGEMHSRIYLDPSVLHPAWEYFDSHSSAKDWSSMCRTHLYHSDILKQKRRFWTYSTGTHHDSELPLVILLDGEFWVESMPLVSAIDDCTQKKHLPPAVYVMIDAISFKQRAEDLTCNPTFWQAVIEEIVPMVAEHYSITGDHQKTVVAGQSYGGLSALYAALNWPERFGNVISQSGSFWWPNHALMHNSHQPDITQLLPESLYIDNHIESLGNRHKLKIYMEVGLREEMMIPLNQQVSTQLSNNNHNVFINLYDGGHDRLIWREGLIKGLIKLLNR